MTLIFQKLTTEAPKKRGNEAIIKMAQRDKDFYRQTFLPPSHLE